LAFSTLRAFLPAIAVAFASPHVRPFVLVERSVAIRVELRKPCVDPVIGFDIFRGAVQPFLLADHAVTVGVQLGEQLAVTAFAFSFLRMQGPGDAQHGNDSNYNCIHGFCPSGCLFCLIGDLRITSQDDGKVTWREFFSPPPAAVATRPLPGDPATVGKRHALM
jgi:hypothetical protein